MSSSIIQLLVLAAVAVFLIWKLKSVLGTREGFEKPPAPPAEHPLKHDIEITEATAIDHDIIDHAPEGSSTALALSHMKQIEPSFSVNTFLQGARGAYEMILMAFEKGDIDSIRSFIAADVEEAFDTAIEARHAQGLRVEAEFIGLNNMTLASASFDPATRQAEITVSYTGELTHAVYNKENELIEGSTKNIKRQRDLWTYSREMGASDPNWKLIATGE